MRLHVSLLWFVFYSILAYQTAYVDGDAERKFMIAQIQSNFKITSARDVIIPMPPPAEFQVDHRSNPVLVMTIASICVGLGMLIGWLVHLLST